MMMMTKKWCRQQWTIQLIADKQKACWWARNHLLHLYSVLNKLLFKKERKKEEQYHRKTNQHQRHQNKKPKTAEKNGNIINSASNNTRRTVEFSWRAPPQEANAGAGEERKMKSKQKHTDRTAYLTCRLCGHPESTPSVMSSSLLLFHTCVTATLSSPHVPELHRLTTRRGCPRDCRRSNASHRQLSSTSLTGGPPLHC